MGYGGPLDGVRVVDLADASGSLCGKLLSELGAETILIEPPDGSPLRNVPPLLACAAGRHSLFFAYANAGKRSLVLDLELPEQRQRLDSLLDDVDIVITSELPAPSATAADPVRLHQRHSKLIVLSITPFGAAGPRSQYCGSDLICQALGGMLAVNGVPNQRPQQGAGLPAYRLAALYGAIAVVAALEQRARYGRGPWIDLSIQECVAASLGHVIGSYLSDAQVPRRQGAAHWSGDFHIAAAARGFVLQTAAGDWTTLREWLTSEEPTAGLTDQAWNDAAYRQAHMAQLFAKLEAWSRRQCAEDLFEAAQLRRLAFAPIRAPQTLGDDRHLNARRFFAEIVEPDLQLMMKQARAPFLFSESPCPAPRAAPSLGDWRGFESAAPIVDHGAASAVPTDEGDLPLSGIRVIDFSWVVAGPLATRILADLGAEVIKIERVESPATADPLGRNLNRGKRSLAVDLTMPQGIDLARQLIASADVVLDNFSSRVMPNFGLHDAALRALRPNLVNVSLSGFGHSGPYRNYVSFGPTLEALSGHTWLMRSNRHQRPYGWGFAFSDMIAGCCGALATLAALWHRRRTTMGQFVEIAQYETLVSSLGVHLLQAINPQLIAAPDCVDHASQEMPSAPHGVFRCADEGTGSEQRDRWCAVAVFDDAAWQRCRSAMGNPGWADDPRFDSAASRHQHRQALHAHFESWTSVRRAEDVMATLQAHRIGAAVVAEADDVCERDPQLAHRGYWQSVAAPAAVTGRIESLPWRCDGRRIPVCGLAPRHGEHTDSILQDLLGLERVAVQRLRTDKIIM